MKFQLFFLVLILFSSACKSGEEELAVFEGGKILRKELREFYLFRGIPSNENTTSIKTQSSIVENLVVQSLAEKEIVKKKLDESALYKKALELSEIQLIANLYKKNFLDQYKSKEKLQLADIQFLLVLPNLDDPEKHLEKLNSLSSDKEIFSYIKENTAEDQRKPLGGFFEPICINCQDDVFVPAFKEGLDSNDKKFRITKFGDKVFIYRVVEKKLISASELEKFLVKRFSKFRDLALEFQNNTQSEKEKQLAKYYAEDEPALTNKAKMFAQRILETFEQKAWQDEYEKIQTKLGFKLSENLKNETVDFSKLNPDTVLFEIQNKSFTLNNLQQEYQDFRQLVGNEGQDKNVEMMNFLQSISIPKFLLVDTEEGKKVKDSERYNIQWNLLKKNIAWSVYLKDIQDKMEVSEEEIKNTYEMGKNFAYAEDIPGQSGKKRPLPYNSVKARIKEEIQNNKLRTSVEGNIKKLKEDYKVIFFPEKLKAGEV